MVDLPRSVWLPALIVFLAVALGTVSAVLLWEVWRERRRKLDLVAQLRALADDGPADDASRAVFRTAAAEQAAWVQNLADRMPRLRDVELLITQAGMGWPLQSFLIGSVGSALALGLGALALSGSLIIGVLAAGAGASLPYLYVKHRRTRRFAMFEEELPESVDLIGRALRAGHPLSAGFKMAADDGAEPVAGELRRVFEEQRFGLSLQDSLLGLADRVNIVDVRILVTAILIQREVGGNLAEILDNLTSVIRARFTIRRQLRVYTAQGRLTGYLLAVLPIVLGLLIYWLNPEYMSILFTDPAGKVLIGVGAVMQFAGFLWIRRIVNIEI